MVLSGHCNGSPLSPKSPPWLPQPFFQNRHRDPLKMSLRYCYMLPWNFPMAFQHRIRSTPPSWPTGWSWLGPLISLVPPSSVLASSLFLSEGALLLCEGTLWNLSLQIFILQAVPHLWFFETRSQEAQASPQLHMLLRFLACAQVAWTLLLPCLATVTLIFASELILNTKPCFICGLKKNKHTNKRMMQ